MAGHDMKKATKEFLKFGDVEIKKIKLYHCKEIIGIIDVLGYKQRNTS